MVTPLVNGQAYSWVTIELKIQDVLFIEIKKISYTDDQEMENLMYGGRYPTARGYGGIKPEASITLAMSAVLVLQAASPTGRVQDIPEFTTTVSFTLENGKVVTDTLHSCRFKKNGRDMSEGDMSIDVELPMLVSHVSWHKR